MLRNFRIINLVVYSFELQKQNKVKKLKDRSIFNLELSQFFLERILLFYCK